MMATTKSRGIQSGAISEERGVWSCQAWSCQAWSCQAQSGEQQGEAWLRFGNCAMGMHLAQGTVSWLTCASHMHADAR